tara:strand:+ start:654 stop:1700 length:1047 start_codon:yes stop_codon:yes gene_type:complete
MKLYKQLLFILVVLFKTETVFSKNNLFNVNNIELEKKDKVANNKLVDQAIKKGFKQLTTRILLNEDIYKLSDLKFSSIKQLVAYYQIKNVSKENTREELLSFNITFDKDKIHDLFYKIGISYSKISDKELYILPLLIQKNEIFIFNNNFFYKNWNKIYENDLIEFILPLENIEIIQNINNYKKNLINLNVTDLFQEYTKKNLALVLIDKNKFGDKKIYIKSIIQGKKISKNLDLKKQKLSTDKINEKVIIEIKKELINIVKSKNLIDIRTPFFLNAKLDLNNKSNLVTLNSRVNKIDSIENIYVQEFNKDYVNLRIKYLGNLEKIINQLNIENIELKLINDQWVIKTL